MEKYKNFEKGNYEKDEKEIIRRFQELPSSEITLLAVHLMRGEGFIKTLLTGQIATSKELSEKLQGDTFTHDSPLADFVKTHRGFYMGNLSRQSRHHSNDYISFNVGRAQKLYAESQRHSTSKEKEFTRGLGFAFPAKRLLEDQNVTPSWGGINIKKALSKIEGTHAYETTFDIFKNLDTETIEEYQTRTPKDVFLNYISLGRKSGLLTGDDQAEINMHGEHPRLPIDAGIICIPENAKDTIITLLSLTIQSLTFTYKEKIKEVFDIDIEKINATERINNLSNVYWYPQKNIDLAIQYLSTNPQKIEEILIN